MGLQPTSDQLWISGHLSPSSPPMVPPDLARVAPSCNLSRDQLSPELSRAKPSCQVGSGVHAEPCLGVHAWVPGLQSMAPRIPDSLLFIRTYTHPSSLQLPCLRGCPACAPTMYGFNLLLWKSARGLSAGSLVKYLKVAEGHRGDLWTGLVSALGLRPNSPSPCPSPLWLLTAARSGWH